MRFDAKWIPYLLGAVTALTAQQTWDQDQRFTTDEARNLLELFAAAKPCGNPPSDGLESEDCMGCCLRWNDGVLQMFTCGEWQDVPGTPGGLPGPSGIVSPIGGGSLPAGECREFDLHVSGSGSTLLPVPVSTGDQVTVSAMKGAWSDGFPSPLAAIWYCPIGTLYGLGICAGIAGSVPADPLNTAPHMVLLAALQTAGTYSDFPNDPTTYTIQAGVSDDQLIFQANDSNLSDNGGDISIHVKVCSPVPLPIGITYTFGTGPAGVSSGGIITITSTDDAGTQRFDFALTECCKVEVLSESGWVTAGSTSSPAYFDCASVLHTHSGADVAPSAFLNPVDSGRCIANGSGVFSVQVRITKL